jgi:hypothetical protein
MRVACAADAVKAQTVLSPVLSSEIERGARVSVGDAP